MWLVARCHVMSCDVIWCVFILCDAISCCVMSRNALRCHVMSSHVMSCHLLWSDAVQWDEILWVCDALWLVAMSRCVVRNGCVGWIGRWSGDPNYTDLLRTTQYYKVLLRYYSVLHSTTPVLLCTTKYYSSTNFVLQSTTPVLLCARKYYSSTTLYYKVLHCTTKYYSSTTPYYKVLLQYYSSTTLYYKVLLQCYSVLQSTTSTTLYYKVLLQYHSVLQRTTPVLVCTARYYSSTTLYYKVLFQYYSVLQSTTPVLVCTTKYYSSTTLYCTELPQYYSVLQSTTPVLILYYKVLLQYYSVLHRSTPVQLCTTKYYSSTTLYYKVLLRYYSLYYKVRICKARSTNVTKCCACHARWLSWLIFVTYETSFTMRRATGITLQPHQILRLPRKMTLMIDLRHIWNVIYNARSNRHHPPTSPNTAPATQKRTPKSKRNSPRTVEASIPMRGRFDHDPNMIRPWSEHELVISHPPVRRGYFSRFGDAFCIENYNFSRSGYLPRFHRILRLPQKVTLQDHQMLRLPRKMTLMIDLRHIWNVIYNAQSNRHHPPCATSPNTSPATQNDSHDWSASHMERHLQCAEQQASPSNLTKYSACLSALQNLSEILRERLKRQFQCAADSTMIRTWTRHLAPARSPRLLFALRRRILYWKLQHFALRLSTQISPNTAPATKSDTPRSPNTAPATQNHSHDWCPSHMTRHLQCAEQQISSSNITKCCACHAKWLASSILVTYETLFTLRGATSITFQVHQMLRLPRKMTLMIDVRHIWNVISNARSNKHHPPTSPNTAPATQNCIPKSKRNCPKTVEVSIPMRGRFNMIRTRSEHELVISHPPVRRGYFSRFGDAFCIENYNFSRSGYLPRFHRILRLPQKVTLRHHQILRLPRKVTLRHHQMLRLPRKVTLRPHQILRLPRKVRLLLNCYWTELLLSCYWTVTELLLNWYWTVTELLRYWAVTELLLNCYWTVTELNCYWTVTQLLLNWPVTELLLNWAVTQLLLDCYWTVTELTCFWAVTELLLNWYWTVTELILNWAVTELLLNWTVTGLSCYSTVTELTCYWTELLLNCYWTVTELFLNCYWTDLLLSCYWTVTELLLCTATWTVTVLDSLHF